MSIDLEVDEQKKKDFEDKIQFKDKETKKSSILDFDELLNIKSMLSNLDFLELNSNNNKKANTNKQSSLGIDENNNDLKLKELSEPKSLNGNISSKNSKKPNKITKTEVLSSDEIGEIKENHIYDKGARSQFLKRKRKNNNINSIQDIYDINLISSEESISKHSSLNIGNFKINRKKSLNSDITLNSKINKLVISSIKPKTSNNSSNHSRKSNKSNIKSALNNKKNLEIISEERIQNENDLNETIHSKNVSKEEAKMTKPPVMIKQEIGEDNKIVANNDKFVIRTRGQTRKENTKVFINLISSNNSEYDLNSEVSRKKNNNIIDKESDKPYNNTRKHRKLDYAFLNNSKNFPYLNPTLMSFDKYLSKVQKKKIKEKFNHIQSNLFSNYSNRAVASSPSKNKKSKKPIRYAPRYLHKNKNRIHYFQDKDKLDKNKPSTDSNQPTSYYINYDKELEEIISYYHTYSTNNMKRENANDKDKKQEEIVSNGIIEKDDNKGDIQEKTNKILQSKDFLCNHYNNFCNNKAIVSKFITSLKQSKLDNFKNEIKENEIDKNKYSPPKLTLGYCKDVHCQMALSIANELFDYYKTLGKKNIFFEKHNRLLQQKLDNQRSRNLFNHLTKPEIKESFTKYCLDTYREEFIGIKFLSNELDKENYYIDCTILSEISSENIKKIHDFFISWKNKQPASMFTDESLNYYEQEQINNELCIPNYELEELGHMFQSSMNKDKIEINSSTVLTQIKDIKDINKSRKEQQSSNVKEISDKKNTKNKSRSVNSKNIINSDHNNYIEKEDGNSSKLSKIDDLYSEKNHILKKQYKDVFCNKSNDESSSEESKTVSSLDSD